MKSAFAPGSEVRCCFRHLFFPVKAEIKVEEVIPYESIVWSARKKGFLARNRFSFQRQDRGVLVTSRESFTGFFVKAFGFFLPVKRMRSMIAAFLKDLKTASEGQFIL